MRTIQRVGIVTGSLGIVVLFVAQFAVALGVVWGVVGVGLAAGLAMAKWLPREWYGRQFAAGLRAGGLACGIAALGALASLVIFGPHDSAALLSRSPSALVDGIPLVQSFSFLGWSGMVMLAVLVMAAAGVAIAAVAAQAFALSKNRRTIRVVTQARLTALALSHDLAWESLPAPMTGGPALAPSVPPALWLGQGTNAGLAGMPIPRGMPAGLMAPTSGPAMPDAPPRRAPATPQSATVSPRRSTMGPARDVPPPAPPSRREPEWEREPAAAPAAGVDAEAADATDVDADTATLPVAPRRAKPRKTSRARPADQQLTQAMRDALAAWAENSPEDQAGDAAADPANVPARRPAQPSTYLNSSAPAPKKRKRNNTRDWLC
jgi:hypothetical protein